MTWMRQPSWQGIALFSVRMEFWRSTGAEWLNVAVFAVQRMFDDTACFAPGSSDVPSTGHNGSLQAPGRVSSTQPAETS